MSEDVDAGVCQGLIEELNRVGRLWDKNGTRLYPIVDRTVAAIVLCRNATDPAQAKEVLAACRELSVWIEAHRVHLAEMTDLVQTMLMACHIPANSGHWAKACDKG